MATTRTRRTTSKTGKTRDYAAIQKRIIPARDATPIRSMLVYARNKVGKTTLFASASEIGKTLIIDCEEGTSSIHHSAAEVYKISTWEEIDEIYWYLANRPHGYKFVAIDPITALGQKAIDFTLREKAERSLADDPYMLTQQDWGKVGALMRNVVTTYRELPDIFLLISAYERRRRTDDEDADLDYVIGPDAQPSVKSYLMGRMDIIGRLYVKNTEDDADKPPRAERRLLTGVHEVYEAGDRSGNLPRILREPTMAKIMERINRRR